MMKMIAFKTSYPEFVPNQVLTNTQLNQLREHLDAQDRLGRIRLVGMGRVCGLQWTQDPASHHITLSEGFGVSSEGYLITAQETAFTHFRTYKDPDVDQDGALRYEPWQTPGDVPGQIDILELLDAEAVAEDESATALAAATAVGRVLVLYLEKRPIELTSCLVTDCDNKGLNIHLSPRALLVKVTDLQTVMPCEGPLPRVRIPRLHTEVVLRAVTTASDINDGYERIVSAAVPPLIASIQTAYDKYGKFLELDADFMQRVSALEQGMKSAADTKGITQYHYDAVKDVATAYNEVVSAACELITDCCVERDFPRHLMLGAIDGTDGYVNEFSPSPVRNVMHGDLERIRKLFRRIEVLCQSMDFGAGGGKVQITPSHTEAYSLGSRAIPVYYNDSSEMRDHWQPTRCCAADPPWSYHTHSDPSSDLEYDYSRCTFLRIEGHLDADCSDAAKAILKERRQHNAALDVLCTHLGDGDGDGEKGLAAVLAEIGQKRVERLGKLRDALSARVASEIEVHSKALRDLTKQAEEESRKWLATRTAQELYCDASHLEVDYLAVRSAIQCQFYSIRGILTRMAEGLAEPKEVSVGGEFASGAKFVLLDRLASTIAAQREGSAVTDERISESLEALAAEDVAQLVPLALQAALDSLLENLRALLEEHLPQDLAELQYFLFLERYKAVVCDLIYFLLLCHAYGFPLTGTIDGEVKDGDPPSAEEEEPMTRELLSATRSCHDRKVAALYHVYRHMRDKDLTRFANLAAAYDGLEHQAGVEKCGTFVLVCEPAGEEDRVVADFSLPCHLACCCQVDPDEICLPPVALPDYRILTLQTEDEGKTYLPVSKGFQVLANDYDPRFQTSPGQSPAPGLELILENAQSELGAKLRATPGGIVEYELASPTPAVVDRFSYRLLSKDEVCPGEDTACVLVLLLPEAKPRTGTIVGIVRDEDEARQPESTVTILETGASALADPKGMFTFTDLIPGTYTLQATLGSESSSPKPVTVGEGATVTVDLVLLRSTGAIAGIVVFEGGGPASGSTVTILETEETDLAGPDGRYGFSGLQPNTYTLLPSFGELVGKQKKVSVQAGQTAELNLSLPAQEGTGSVRVTVVDRKGSPLPGALVSVVDSATGGDVFVAEQMLQEDGASKFDEVPSARYDISASLVGFARRVSAGLNVPAGVVSEFNITLEPLAAPSIPDLVVGRVAELVPGTPIETRTKVEALYTERYISQLAGLGKAAREPSVKESVSYQRAEQFLTEALVDPGLTEPAVLDAYKQVSSSLAKAVPAASPENADIYRDLLRTVSLAALDRLTVANPETLSSEASAALDEMAGTLKQAGVDMNQLKTEWQGDRLRTELKLGTTEEMMALLG